MYETEAELSGLEEVLEAGKSNSGDHLASLFGQGEWMSARQLAHHLQGIGSVALATLNSKMEPRVALMEAVLLHGRFFIAVQRDSGRARHLAANPATSLTYTRDEDVVITVNGNARFVESEEADLAGLEAEWKKKYGRDVLDAVLFIRIEPTAAVAFAVNPDLFPTA